MDFLLIFPVVLVVLIFLVLGAFSYYNLQWLCSGKPVLIGRTVRFELISWGVLIVSFVVTVIVVDRYFIQGFNMNGSNALERYLVSFLPFVSMFLACVLVLFWRSVYWGMTASVWKRLFFLSIPTVAHIVVLFFCVTVLVRVYDLTNIGVVDGAEMLLRPGSLVDISKKDSYEKGDRVVVAIYDTNEKTCRYAVRDITGTPGERVDFPLNSSQESIDEMLQIARQKENWLIRSISLGDGQYFGNPPNKESGLPFYKHEFNKKSIAGIYKGSIFQNDVRSVFSYFAGVFRHPLSLHKSDTAQCSLDISSVSMETGPVVALRYKALTEKLQPGITPYNSLEDTREWETYQNDVLGISFRYPTEWGMPHIDFPLTNLKKHLEDSQFDEESRKVITLTFSNLSNLSLGFFSKEYPGKYLSSAESKERHELIDNIDVLRHGEPICAYRYGVLGKDDDYSVQTDAICHEDMKVMLYEDSGFRVDGGLPSHLEVKNGEAQIQMVRSLDYTLAYLSYRTLRNGVYDSLLIEEKVSQDGRDATDPIDSIADYLSQKGVKEQEQYEKQKAMFQSFVKSVTALEPIAEKHEIVLDANEQDDENIRAITAYYTDLQNHDFESAYARKVNEVPFEEFRRRYENTYKAVPSHFTKEKSGVYSFAVDYQEDNRSPLIYHVTMRVEDGKLTTLSLEEVFSEDQYGRSLSARAVLRGNTASVLLTRDGNERVVDQLVRGGEDVWSGFTSVSFAENGRYLLYQIQGWEFGGLKIYDVKKGRVAAQFNTIPNYGFSKNGKYFYACDENLFSGEIFARIFSVPNFKEQFDAMKNGNIKDSPYVPDDIVCVPLANGDAVSISVMSGSHSGEKDNTGRFTEKWEYDFDTGLVRMR